MQSLVNRSDRVWLAYGVAVLAIGAAYLVRSALDPWLGNRSPFLAFTIPILLAAQFLGRGPAILSALLSLGIGVAQFSELGAPEEALVHLATFAIVCVGIIVLAQVIDRARREKDLQQHGLERREQHLRSILETVTDAMIVIDERGGIRSFSAAAEKMFGYSESEILNENISALMPSPDRELHDSYLERYLETGVRKMIGIGRVTTARHRDGSTFPIDLHVGEAKIGDERVFTGFVRDLTERQQTEMRLHDLQSELAHVARVSEMGTFATSIAHELNQPLTAIANYVETSEELLREPDKERLEIVREAMRECANQSVRAGQIVRRLRDFISRGETERRIESLARVVNEASALALIGAGERGVEVEVKLDPNVDGVLIDRIQIQQVILNLVRNAIEAMAESQVRRLRIASRSAPDGLVEVTIEDSGPGLPPELADQLFQPFVSTKAAGMGLGLSICHTIVNSHGGRIWSTPSRLGGTAFHFTLVDTTGTEDAPD
ncbi:MAG TPA: PAS domain S-box protein [Allosphingosinicella sp.]|nr:PAS domain S-box protein [Allosphingosinicella sp.]